MFARSVPEGHQLELPIGRNEGDILALLPALDANARVQADVVQERRIDKGQREIRHPREIARDDDLALHFARDNGAVGVEDRVDLLDDVKVDLVLRVLDPRLAPLDRRQRAGRQRRRDPFLS